MSLEDRLRELADAEELTVEAAQLAIMRVILQRCADDPEHVPVSALAEVLTGSARVKQAGGTEYDLSKWLAEE